MSGSLHGAQSPTAHRHRVHGVFVVQPEVETVRSFIILASAILTSVERKFAPYRAIQSIFRVQKVKLRDVRQTWTLASWFDV